MLLLDEPFAGTNHDETMPMIAAIPRLRDERGLTVLRAEHDMPAVIEIARAIEEDRTEAIVLGCAGMADLADSPARRHGLPVLDGVACAVGLCESMTPPGLETSGLGGHQRQR